jgi:hypothetical protein
MTDQFLLKGSLVIVFVTWFIIKYESRSYVAEVEVTRLFRIALYTVGVYFLVAGFLVDFLDLVFPPWVEPVPHTSNENWIWAKLIATNFTFALGLMYLGAGGMKKISTVWVTAILFMFIYDVRNSFINFFEVGVPEPSGSYGWLSVVDGSIIWPATAAILYQLGKARPRSQAQEP